MINRTSQKLASFKKVLKDEGVVIPRCEPVQLDHLVLIGTHHKTGTSWMQNVFKRISDELQMRYHRGEQSGISSETAIFMQDHSKFDFSSLGRDYRGLHIIRDPRDRIISGVYYHEKSDEPWLHAPRTELEGMTYQEKIRSLGSMSDKIEFEMRQSGRMCIEEMLSWDYFNCHFYEVKYENLIEDYQLNQFHEIFNFLGFPGVSIPVTLSHAWANSLFSGKLKKNVHHRSGKSRQWERYMDRRNRELFIELFGDCLIKLGYEQDHDWAASGTVSET